MRGKKTIKEQQRLDMPNSYSVHFVTSQRTSTLFFLVMFQTKLRVFFGIDFKAKLYHLYNILNINTIKFKSCFFYKNMQFFLQKYAVF